MSRLVSLVPALALALAACTPQGRPGAPAPESAPYDVVIHDGRIVDGTGAAWFYGDVALRGDRIARIAPRGVLRGAAARERVDAAGLVVAPGFIDIQSQSVSAFLGEGDGRVLSKVTQGVTTEIMGEGTTPAIVNARFFNADTVPAEYASFTGPRGFDAWLRAMEAHGASVNVGSFLGASNVRRYGRGLSQGAPTAAELDSMRQVVRWAMEDGAFGIASALIYPPAAFATTEELVEAAKAMAPYGGVYITHMRSEADRLLEAMDEALRIGREGGVPVEIYHLKAGGTRNWPLAARAIAKIDSARAAGQDVQADMYPYTAGATALSACFPAWASADGALMRNLADSAARARMRAEMMVPSAEWENLCELAGPEGVQVLGLQTPENARWSGRRLKEVADSLGKPWPDAAADLVLQENGRVSAIFFLMSEDNVRLQLRQRWMKFGTDAGGHDPARARGPTHPRAYGTFTRILGRYVRDERVIPLEDAIRKMTSATATRLSLHDRGVLREGLFADVVVFDPATIGDPSTFERPHQLSTGVRHVFVNGVAVLRDGAHTGALPGRALRGPGYRPREEN